jgi:membrane-bound metal-dependent hydrolase YbcI (DUF457 family)
MLGKTHRAGGTVFMMVGFEVMRSKGLLLPDVNPFIQLAVMYPISQWGSTLPDLDHHWGSVGSKSPVNWVAHKILHLSRPKHRSWQTHSLLFTGGALMLLYSLVMLGDSQWLTASAMDWLVMRMMVVGLILGVGSHLVLDFINPSGIHLYPGYKIRLVPRTSFFATGGPWETFIYYVCIVVSVFALANICMSFWDTNLWELFNKIKQK